MPLHEKLLLLDSILSGKVWMGIIHSGVALGGNSINTMLLYYMEKMKNKFSSDIRPWDLKHVTSTIPRIRTLHDIKLFGSHVRVLTAKAPVKTGM